jgi:hypothetical protein
LRTLRELLLRLNELESEVTRISPLVSWSVRTRLVVWQLGQKKIGKDACLFFSSTEQ